MPDKEQIQHDLLLIITVAIVILFATGIAPGTGSGSAVPVVVP